MVIRRMNTVLVKHNKILFGIFSFVIIISFVWFFTPGLDGSMFFGQNPSSPNAVVGTVFGQKIKVKDFQEAMRERILILTAMTGRDSSQYRDYISQSLFEEMAREIAAQKLGVTVTNAELEDFIKNNFALFKGPDGKFDPALYKKFAETVLETDGYTLAQFEGFVRKMLAAEKLSKMFADGVVVTPGELDMIAELQLEKFNARKVTFPFSSFKPAAKPKEEEVLGFYKANQKLFMTAPMLKAEIVRFAFTVPQITPSEPTVQAYYKAHENEFIKDGKVQPLAQVRGKIVDAIRVETGKRLALEAAKNFRDGIYDAVAADSIETAKGQLEVFAKLAAKDKLQIIKTDWFTPETKEIKGIGSEPALVAALFKTNPAHTPLLRTSLVGERGVYVAASTAFQTSRVADFADVKDKAEELLQTEKSKQAAKEVAYDFAHKVMAQKDPAASLEGLAKKSKGVVVKLPEFTRETRPEDDPVTAFAMQMGSSLADKTLSSAEAGPDSMVLVFLDGRRLPAASEKAAMTKQLEGVLQYSKQMVQQGSLINWINSNSYK